ncbi:MAG: hypothetical protein HYX32_08115 [Actinobacteria bacterium]|nr:hypothetical protein [Actinomycetota bacterium]
MADPGTPLPGPADLEAVDERALSIMTAHWREPGYTVPNPDTYPAQFLWDSCFHAIIWAHLGEPERACTELRNLFAHQADDGFVAHMTYWHDPDQHAGFWGRRFTSCITQPPMYGHALAELHRRGIAIDDDLLDAAERGLRFLHEHRGRDGVAIVHPWESGCDDSPRWDNWCAGEWTALRWRDVKGELLDGIELDPETRSPIGSRVFEVDAAGFEALVAFNADELCALGGWMADQLAADAAGALDDRWQKRERTFADRAHIGTASKVRTLEALLPVLATKRERVVADVFSQLRDPNAFGSPFGPPSVHRQESVFDASAYWRGPTWPQLIYLFWVAARRHGRTGDAALLRDRLIRGAMQSGFAEYWDPDTGAGHGARPQSWTCLAAVVAGQP